MNFNIFLKNLILKNLNNFFIFNKIYLSIDYIYGYNILFKCNMFNTTFINNY